MMFHLYYLLICSTRTYSNELMILTNIFLVRKYFYYVHFMNTSYGVSIYWRQKARFCVCGVARRIKRASFGVDSHVAPSVGRFRIFRIFHFSRIFLFFLETLFAKMIKCDLFYSKKTQLEVCDEIIKFY